MALHALTMLIGRGLAADLERYQATCALHVVPPLCPLDVFPTDFGRGAELVARAHESTAHWLDAGMPSHGPRADVELLQAHDHTMAPGVHEPRR